MLVPIILNLEPHVPTPRDFSGLVGWWRADSNVNLSSDNTWGDLSGVGSTFVAPNSTRPTLTTGINGHAALAFNGTDDLLRAGQGFDDTDSITVVIVGDLELTRGRDGFGSGWNFIFPAFDDSDPTTNRPYLVLTEGSTAAHASNDNSGYPKPTAPSIKMLTFSNVSGNSVLKIYDNNVLLDTKNIGSSIFRDSTIGLELGQHIGGPYVSGYMQEIIIYDRVLTDTERNDLYDDYLEQRYYPPPAPSPIEGLTLAGRATAVATLSARGSMSGSAAGRSTAVATIRAKGSMNGQSNGRASVVANMTPKGKLQGNIAGRASTLGTIRGKGTLNGSAAGRSTALSTLQGKGSLSSQMAGRAAVVANLSLIGRLSANMAGRATSIASIRGSGRLQGNIAGISSTFATILARAALAGSSSGRSTALATIVARGTLQGEASGRSSVIGLVTARGLLQAVAQGRSSVVGVIRFMAVGGMEGVAHGRATAIATLTARLILNGEASGHSSCLALLTGRGSMKGVVAGSSQASAMYFLILQGRVHFLGTSSAIGLLREKQITQATFRARSYVYNRSRMVSTVTESDLEKSFVSDTNAQESTVSDGTREKSYVSKSIRKKA